MATHTIWSELPAEKAHEILCKIQETQKKLYRASLEILAQNLHKRIPIVLEMPKVERHALFQQLLAHPSIENLSFNLISSWLVDTQTPLLCAWLDSVGIKHDSKGFFESDNLAAPSPEKLKSAVDALLKTSDAITVAIYLRAFNEIDGIHWASLESLIQNDPRLALKK